MPGTVTEFEITAALLSPGLSQARRHWLCGALQEPLDWTALFRIAIAHRVTAVLERGLRHYCADLIPEEITDALRRHNRARQVRNEGLEGELVRVTRRLSEAGIDVLSFKGPALARQLYRDPALRDFGDLDLLIRWQDWQRVRELLPRLGYAGLADGSGTGIAQSWRLRAMDRCNGQDGFYDDIRHILIEPHWNLFPNTFDLRIDYDGIWRRSEAIEIAGGCVRSPSRADMMLIACLHGSKEEWWRLNWVCDVAEALANPTVAPLCRSAVIDLARSQDCLRAVLVGFGLANRLLGAELSEDLCRAIRNDQQVEALVDHIAAEKIDAFSPGPPAPLSKITRVRLAVHEGRRRKLGYLLRTLFAPRPAHIRMVALPRWANFLYYPLRGVHDYLLLPIWRLRLVWQRPRRQND